MNINAQEKEFVKLWLGLTAILIGVLVSIAILHRRLSALVPAVITPITIERAPSVNNNNMTGVNFQGVEYGFRVDDSAHPVEAQIVSKDDNFGESDINPELPGTHKRSTASVISITRKMRVTAYCHCDKCCGKWADGITASGKPVTANKGRFVAAPVGIPFGTLISIPGYSGGLPVPVLDRGGAIRGDRLDVFFVTHQEALNWGVRELAVVICERSER